MDNTASVFKFVFLNVIGVHKYHLRTFLSGTMLMIILGLLIPGQTFGVETEGPPQPSCDGLSGATKIKLPLVRTALLDAGMYLGMVLLWPHNYAPQYGSMNQFKQSWCNPPEMDPHKSFFELDHDPWVINTVLHGLYGSEVYLAGRTYGHSGFVSFMYAVFASVTWEYLIESWFQRPSGIDLTWTPFAGAVIGELRFQLIRIICRGGASRITKNLLIAILDPLGQFERSVMGCLLSCRHAHQ